ncbi:MAG: hypothetical protein KC587_12110 [Nitrospira sp.]|nr:hypothetical protein [Nitrospira sp.]MCA9457400.1 hypothetical protein [Nitrospira sp.]MCW5782702.1 hypothetical protein [Nitrospirales bacterium]
MGRPGTAAIDRCNIACGRLDGYWKLHRNSRDTAAGKIILEKDGERVTDNADEP